MGFIMKTKKDIKILNIQEKNKYTYKLKSNNGEIITLALEFMDIENEPEENDYIYMKEELLDPHYEGYSTFYTFRKYEKQIWKRKFRFRRY